MLATLVSCGGDNSSKSTQNEVDIDKVLNKLVNDKVIDENTKKSILSEFNNVKDSIKRKKAENASEVDVTKAVKINSYDMFEEIYKDRSLYLSKYTDKEMILTDLLVKNVKTIDVGEGEFVKCVIAVPCNVKKQMVGVDFNFDSYEKPNVYFKSQYLMPAYELANSQPIIIELKNADEFKKLNMLEWEYNVEDSGDDNTYYRKISIAGKIDKADIKYDAGRNANDDIKAKHIKVTIRNAVIVK